MQQYHIAYVMVSIFYGSIIARRQRVVVRFRVATFMFARPAKQLNIQMCVMSSP